jgi:hypothetical protein
MTAVSLLHDDLSTRHMPIAGLNSRIQKRPPTTRPPWPLQHHLLCDLRAAMPFPSALGESDV